MARDFFFPGARLIPWPWNLVGLLPMVFGMWLNLDADRALKVHGTTVKPFEQSRVLVTVRSYGISRHPMYLGMVLILLGVAVLLGSLAPFVVALLLWSLLDRRFVRTEERMMHETFGQEWQNYAQNVRRWI